MVRFIIVLLLIGVPLSGCGKKKGAGVDKCKKAQKEASAKWDEAATAWNAVHKAWADKTLVARVRKDMLKRAPSIVGTAKAEANVKGLKEYVDFKIEHAKKAAAKSAVAAKAAQGEAKKARKTAGRAFRAGYDQSGSRHSSAKWFSEPLVVKIDESQRKAYNLSTEARNLSRQADAACAK